MKRLKLDPAATRGLEIRLSAEMLSEITDKKGLARLQIHLAHMKHAQHICILYDHLLSRGMFMYLELQTVPF